MGRELNERMQKVVDDTIISNDNQLKEIEVLISEFEELSARTEKNSKLLLKTYEKLDSAHGMLNQGEFANYYTQDLEPSAESIIDLYSFNINPTYQTIKGDVMDSILSQFPDRDKLIDELNPLNTKLRDAVDEFVTRNSFTHRLEGMEMINQDISDLSNNNWSYPLELCRNEILHNKAFLQPTFFHGIQAVNPFHIKLYLKYMPLCSSQAKL